MVAIALNRTLFPVPTTGPWTVLQLARLLLTSRSYCQPVMEFNDTSKHIAVDPPPESRNQFSEQLQEVITVPIVVND